MTELLCPTHGLPALVVAALTARPIIARAAQRACKWLVKLAEAIVQGYEKEAEIRIRYGVFHD